MAESAEPRGDYAARHEPLARRLHAHYRRGGADPPFGDPRRDHAAPFEGYYWRLSDPHRGRVVIALCGVCRLPRRRWAVTALASHPGGRVHSSIAERAGGDPDGLGVWAGEELRASERSLRVRLDSGAALEIELRDPVRWSRRRWGGSGPAHLVPGLPQYWHPWLLGGVVQGEATLDGERIALDGATAYAEKNWGREFPRRWWWGQADCFEDGDLCAAFAGGPMRVAGAALAPTVVLVRAGERLISLAPPLARTATSTGSGYWQVRTRSPTYAIELEGEELGSSVRLPVPFQDRVAVEPRSCQALAGRLRIVVRRRRRVLLRAESRLAGLESAIEEGACA